MTADVWNDRRRAQRPIIGDLDRLEEMDVSLSNEQLRECLSKTGELHVAKLLSGEYTLEPWLRCRLDMDGDWYTAFGIEVTLIEEDGA